MATRTSEKGIAVIKAFEGRALRAYKDVVGVWTIGFGNTNSDAYAVSKIGKIGAGLAISESQADDLLRHSLQVGYEPAVATNLPGCDQPTFDAGASFHYNTGAIGRATWVKKWRARDFAAMGPLLLAWNKAGGKVFGGLDRRRKRELAMILRGDYGPEGSAVPANIIGAPAPTIGMLRQGDTGQEVADLNAALRSIGLSPTEGDSFGVYTEVAVRRFQGAHPQLTTDGVVGPATEAAILREVNARVRVADVSKGAVAAQATTAAADYVGGAHLPIALYVALGVAALAVMLFFTWKYRDELQALATRKGD